MNTIKMLETQLGSPDGIEVNRYEEGSTYLVPDRLAKIFIEQGWANETDPSELEGDSAGNDETADNGETPELETKPEPEPLETKPDPVKPSRKKRGAAA